MRYMNVALHACLSPLPFRCLPASLPAWLPLVPPTLGRACSTSRGGVRTALRGRLALLAARLLPAGGRAGVRAFLTAVVAAFLHPKLPASWMSSCFQPACVPPCPKSLA